MRKLLSVCLAVLTAFSSAAVVGAAQPAEAVTAESQSEQITVTEPTEIVPNSDQQETDPQPAPALEAETETSAVISAEAETENETVAEEETDSSNVLTLSQEKITLGVGESYSVSPSIGGIKVSSGLKWQSMNPSVATVSSNGKITAKKVGSAIVAVKNSDGQLVQCSVTVKNAPSSVKLSKSDLTLGVGEEFIISECTNSGSYGLNFNWSSSNTKVASIEKTEKNKAKITAKSVGTATIKVTMYNGVSKSIKLTVKNAPKSVKLSTGDFKLGAGENFTISECTDSGSYGLDFTWSSSDPTVAAIEKTTANKARINANGVGTAIISVTMYNGVTQRIVLTVKEAPKSVNLSKDNFTLGVGETFIISESTNAGSYGSEFKWSSSNTKTAAISKTTANKAKITALAVGTTTIKITMYNGVSKSIKLTVKSAPKTVSLSKSSLTLGEGEVYQISEKTNSGSYGLSFTWSSNNSGVASVERTTANKANIIAKKSGTATIKVKMYNGVYAECKVTVKKAPSTVAMNTSAITMGLKDSFTLYCDFPNGGVTNTITFTSSNPSVVKVNSKTGLISTYSYGNAVITATTHNGKKAKCVVTVEKNIITDLTLNAKAQEGCTGRKFRSWYYGVDFSVDWCAIFVSWLYNSVGGINKYVVKTDGAGCFAREGVAKGYGKWYESNYSCSTTQPKAGDIVTFTWNGQGRYWYQDAYFSDHVGYVYAVDNTYIYTVEGNTVGSGESYGSCNNSRVVLKRYNKNSGFINGYFRPNYK